MLSFIISDDDVQKICKPLIKSRLFVETYYWFQTVFFFFSKTAFSSVFFNPTGGFPVWNCDTLSCIVE